jgi:thioredoxin-related protein
MRNLKIIVLFLSLIFIHLTLLGQSEKPRLYDPGQNAFDQIREAVKLANAENKHVFIQIGGNWCSWCYLFHDFIKNHNEISSFVDNNYVSIKINYSKENKNLEVLSDLGYPQRFGFPVFVILNRNGQVIHIQDSALLEEGRGYNNDKVLTFFKNWTLQAISPKTYE